MTEFFTYLADSPYRWATVVPDAMPFLWAGALIGHSFVATPAKFKVAELELALALQVGRATFTLFNRVEFLFLAFITTTMIFTQTNSYSWFSYAIIVTSFLVQRFVLRPPLFVHAESHGQGEPPTKIIHHKLYGYLEAVKLIALISLGTMLILY